jgi:DNA-directed RNA polymerase specialized sigma24 family protein
MLEELAKSNSKWFGFALKICRCKSLAADMTQDMYLILANYKEVKPKLVYQCLYHLFCQEYRKREKEVLIDDWSFVNEYSEIKEIDDRELEILNKYHALPWRQQEIILLTYDHSLRQIQEKYPMINYAYANRQVKEGVKKVLGSLDQYDNKRKKSNGGRV